MAATIDRDQRLLFIHPYSKRSTYASNLGVARLGLGAEELHHGLPLAALLAAHARTLLQPQLRTGDLEECRGRNKLDEDSFS